jgi:hypothetical protein
MTNPVFEVPDDPDQFAFGDLPYACDVPYSHDIATFKGPTRVVGRLPDLMGAKKPSYLLTVIGKAEKYRCRKAAEYSSYFGLSTHSWRKSSEMSLSNVFGSSTNLLLSPPSRSGHSNKRLAPLMHFINCHGGQADPTFYGERKGDGQPPSLASKRITGKIKPGTVASVECCYGAELYDSITLSLPLPICQNYLRQGANGYFGSTTIAYGPETGNGAADLITQYFLIEVLGGASLGRAALVARQRFVEQTGELDPVDLKTLAQFNLLGDPSIHPVEVESPTGVPKGIKEEDANRQSRRERRAKLQAVGEFLKESKPTASRKAKRVRKSPTVQAALKNIAREAGIHGKEFTPYAVKTPPMMRGRDSKTGAVASRYYVAVYKPKGPARRVAAVAKEVTGRIVGYRIYTEK